MFDLQQIEELEKGLRQTRLADVYRDTGPLRRELYSKHIEFFAAGAVHQERAFVAANRSGKSFCVCYEASCHLLGWYPHWWVGRRFTRPIVCWAAGPDAKAVRESLQAHFFGPPEEPGTGLIPAERIVRTPTRGGIPDAIDFGQIKSFCGGYSRLALKAYEQGRESFQAARVDVGICDEEPPSAIYSEFLTRLMSTVPGEPPGLMMCAFTPLLGLSEVVQMYLPGGAVPRTPEMLAEHWGWTAEQARAHLDEVPNMTA